MTGLGDFDGDGYDDFAVAAETNDDDERPARIHLFYGAAARLAASGSFDSSSAVLELPSGGFLGQELVAPGDVDGDGTPDLLVGEERRVWLVRGGTRWEGAVEIADVAVGLETPVGRHNLGRLGDLDADGLVDFAIGPVDDVVYLFYGAQSLHDPPLTFDAAQATLTHEALVSWREGSIVALGDLDGDANSDFALSDPIIAGGLGGVYLVMGDGTRLEGTSFLDDVGETLLGQERAFVSDGSVEGHAYRYGDDFPDRAGTSLASGGDLDGDGHPDLAVGAPTNAIDGALGGRVFVLRGGR